MSDPNTLPTWVGAIAAVVAAVVAIGAAAFSGWFAWKNRSAGPREALYEKQLDAFGTLFPNLVPFLFELTLRSVSDAEFYKIDAKVTAELLAGQWVFPVK